MWWVFSQVVAGRLCGEWLDQVGIKLSQLSTKLTLKLNLSLAMFKQCVAGAELGSAQPELVFKVF